jgi:hypothetical protein
MANLFVQGYPQYVGSKIRLAVDHGGPTSYSNIGSSSGTGDVVNATDLGVGGFDSAGSTFAGYDFTNTYFVKALWPASPSSTNAQPKAVFQWFVVSTSAEVANATNLSTYTVRLMFDAI